MIIIYLLLSLFKTEQISVIAGREVKNEKIVCIGFDNLVFAKLDIRKLINVVY